MKASDDVVPVGPLQTEYLRVIDAELMSESEVALQLGYIGGRRGDCTRLQRELGLYPRRDKARSFATHIDYDTAVLIAREIGVAPLDVGL